MTVSLESRGIYELGDVSERLYGLHADELYSATTLNLNNNHLLSLQLPFLGLGRRAPSRGAAAPILQRSVWQACGDFDTRDEEAAEVVILADHSRATHRSGAETASFSSSLSTPVPTSSALRHLSSLSTLLIASNALRTLIGLSGAATTLTTLIAPHNALTSLEGMEQCIHLRYVDLRYNAVETLQGLPRHFCDAAANATAAVRDIAALRPSHDTAWTEWLSFHQAVKDNGDAATMERDATVWPPPPPSLSATGLQDGRLPGVVLLLGHNRLRGAALAPLLSGAGSTKQAASQQDDIGTRPSGLSWTTAITHLDLSFNYIERIKDVCQLLQPRRAVPDDVAEENQGPLPLPHLVALNVSQNPFLVNGSFATELRYAAEASTDSCEPTATAPPMLFFEGSFTIESLSDLLQRVRLSSARVAPLRLSPPDVKMRSDELMAMLAAHWRCFTLCPSSASVTYGPALPLPSARHLTMNGCEAAVLGVALEIAVGPIGAALQLRRSPSSPEGAKINGSSSAITTATDVSYSYLTNSNVPDGLGGCAVMDVYLSTPPPQVSSITQRSLQHHRSTTPELYSSRSIAQRKGPMRSITRTPTTTTTPPSPPSINRQNGTALRQLHFVTPLNTPERLAATTPEDHMDFRLHCGASAVGGEEAGATGTYREPWSSGYRIYKGDGRLGIHSLLEASFISTPPSMQGAEGDTPPLQQTSSLRAASSDLFGLGRSGAVRHRTFTPSSAATVRGFYSSGGRGLTSSDCETSIGVKLQISEAEVAELRRRQRDYRRQARDQGVVMEQQRRAIKQLQDQLVVARQEQVKSEELRMASEKEVQLLKGSIALLEALAAQPPPQLSAYESCDPH